MTERASWPWTAVDDARPDDEECVLVWIGEADLCPGEPWTGYHDAGLRRYVSGEPIGLGRVTHSMPFPPGPTA